MKIRYSNIINIIAFLGLLSLIDFRLGAVSAMPSITLTPQIVQMEEPVHMAQPMPILVAVPSAPAKPASAVAPRFTVPAGTAPVAGKPGIYQGAYKDPNGRSHIYFYNALTGAQSK